MAKKDDILIDPLMSNEQIGEELIRRNDASRTRFMYYQEARDGESFMHTNLIDDEDLTDMLEFYEENLRDYWNKDSGEEE